MAHEAEQARETPDIQTARAVAAIFGTLVLVFIALGGLYAFYRWRLPDAALPPVKIFPAPQLDTKDDGLRDPLIDQQRARLGAYAWVDRSHGIVQVPIERAIALVAARGAGAYDPLPPVSARARP
jgi:hypothetical protein